MAKPKAGVHRNGRNTGSTAFLKMDHYIFDCAAYRAMKAGPRALLWELIRLYNGSNNGAIGLGVRNAAQRIGVSKDTAADYFRVLIEQGFVVSTGAGGFNMKDPQSRRATEWRLTWLRYNNQSPTKEFMDRSKKSTVQKNRTASPKNLDTECEPVAQCPKNPDLLDDFEAAIGPKKPDTYISGHRRGSDTCSNDRSACDLTREAIRSFFAQSGRRNERGGSRSGL